MKYSYPTLRQRLADMLDDIQPIIVFGVSYYPCLAKRADGSPSERVYVTDANKFFQHWGVWPEDDAHKLSISLNDVVEFCESPDRLPFIYAQKLYDEGETSMGGHSFKLNFSDKSQQIYVSGTMLDFLTLPAGQSFLSLTSAQHWLPTTGEISTLPFSWCLYES